MDKLYGFLRIPDDPEFDEFKKNNIVVSDFEYNNLCSLKNNPPCADLYITGSDQVWSQLLSLKENEVFYLNFGDKRTKRISYAASFGMDSYPIIKILVLSYCTPADYCECYIQYPCKFFLNQNLLIPSFLLVLKMKYLPG